MRQLIEAIPEGVFATDYPVCLVGHPITTISSTEGSTFVLNGHRYRVGRQTHAQDHPPLKQLVQRLAAPDSYRLEAEGELLAMARKRGILREAFQVCSGRGSLELEWVRRQHRYQVTRDGVPAGWIGRERPLSRSLRAELDAELTLPLQLFLVWLVLTRTETVHPE